MPNKIMKMVDKRRFAIIVAGGSGSRMGGNIAKQFMTLASKPVIVHTIERFLALPYTVDIIIVLPADYKDYWKEYCFANGLTFRHTLVSGGITRFHSVKNALKYVVGGSLVAVHDGVRPFVHPQFIDQLYQLAEIHKAVVPVINPVDSMRVKEGAGSKVVDRQQYLMVQTPQVFQSDLLINAYKQAYTPVFTDDASVVESTGEKICFTDGNAMNIKITNPGDLVLAEAVLSVF